MLPLTGYLAADLLVRALPARWADALGVGIARAAFALRPPARRRLEANLARLLGPSARRTVRRRAREGFEHFALVLADFLRLGHRGDPAAAVSVRGGRHLAAARASGRGVIVLSAHLGHWERGAAFLAAGGPPVHVVARPHPNTRVEAFFRRRRRAWGVSSLGEAPLWVGAARALRRGEWVALMGDRPGPGRRGSMCAWAAALARRTGALVLPGVMVRLPDGRFEASFEAPLDHAACAAGAWPRAIRSHLERHAGQWMAFEPLPEGIA